MEEFKVKINSISDDSEKIDQLKAVFGQDNAEKILELLREQVGKAVSVNEQTLKILKVSAEIGVVNIEEEKGNEEQEEKEEEQEEKEEEQEEKEEEQEEQEEKEEEQEEKEEEQEEEQEEKEEEQEEKEEEQEEKEEEQEEKEEEQEEKEEARKEYNKHIKERAMGMLENLDAYKNMPTAMQYQIISAYATSTDPSDIWDPEFLNKKINVDENTQMVANVQQIHSMILGGVTMQRHMECEQAKAQVQMEQSDIENKSAQEANQIIISNPKLITELDASVKEKAEKEMAERVKKYLEMATTNKPATQTLMIIGDLKSHMEAVKKDTLESVDAGGEREAEKLYLSQMPVAEMGAVMAAAKDITGNVKIRLDDIDWENEVERNVAIKTLKLTQESAKDFGASEPLVENVVFKFEIKDCKDVDQLRNVCEAFQSAGITSQSSVRAQVDIADNIDEDTKKMLDNEARAVVTDSGITYNKEELETPVISDTLEEGMNSVGDAAMFGAGVAAGVSVAEQVMGLSMDAQTHPSDMLERMEELAYEETLELNGPGTSTTEEE